MRLINTSTGLFEEFIGRNIPAYAILSHTWGSDEVSFQDYKDPPACKTKNGYEKIVMTCELALEKSIAYAWVDTCCIDKSSSAELTEAINSMFSWYSRAQICFVYLPDMPSSRSLGEELSKYRWFTRGWTLQELIAPEHVVFYDDSWSYRGNKKELLPQLAAITGVHEGVLAKTQRLSDIAVGQRLSWAANRETTRIEDSAYCLLGIYGVHMPLLYGEEHQAFRRLQEEIIKSIPDVSIFAWTALVSPGWSVPEHVAEERPPLFSGILARSPQVFASLRDHPIERLTFLTPKEFSVTNKGIKIKTKLALATDTSNGSSSGRRYYLLPVCSRENGVIQAIRLGVCGMGIYVRKAPFDVKPLRSTSQQESLEATASTKYILTRASDKGVDSQALLTRSRDQVMQISGQVDVEMAWPWQMWDHEDRLFFTPYVHGNEPLYLKACVNATIWIYGPRPIRCSIPVQFVFVAFNWTSRIASQLQWAIVDPEAFNTVPDGLQSWLVKFNPSSSEMKEAFANRKVPQTPAFVKSIKGVASSMASVRAIM